MAHTKSAVVLFRESRRVVAKLRDFEFRKKADRLHAKVVREKSSHQVAAECVRHFQEYIECLLRDAQDVRVDQLKLAILYHSEALREELNRKYNGPAGGRHISTRYVTALLVAYSNLKTEIYGRKVPLNACTTGWAEMMSLAVSIWGNKI